MAFRESLSPHLVDELTKLVIQDPDYHNLVHISREEGNIDNLNWLNKILSNTGESTLLYYALKLRIEAIEKGYIIC